MEKLQIICIKEEIGLISEISNRRKSVKKLLMGMSSQNAFLIKRRP